MVLGRVSIIGRHEMKPGVVLLAVLFSLASLGQLYAGKAVEKSTVLRVSFPNLRLKPTALPNRGIINGLDLGLPISEAQTIRGLQFTLIGSKSGNAYGIQVGPLGSIAQQMHGLQMSLIVNNPPEVLSGIVEPNKTSGLQLAGLMNFSKMIRGMQISAFNASDEMKGFQVGAINGGINLKGGQIGIWNIADSVSGFQVGTINQSDKDLVGIQIGFYNYCRNLKGIQLGVINRIKNRSYMTITPLINWAW